MQVLSFGEALAHYMRGEILRYRASTVGAAINAAIEQYLRAFETAPDFSPTAGLLYALAESSPQLAEQIFPRMIAGAPDKERSYRLYLRHLSAIGATERFRAVLRQTRERFGAAEFPGIR